MSRDEYNLSSNLIIVCPITSIKSKQPYFVSIHNEVFEKESNVNIKQVYSLDFTEKGGRNYSSDWLSTNKRIFNYCPAFPAKLQFSFLKQTKSLEATIHFLSLCLLFIYKHLSCVLLPQQESLLPRLLYLQ